MSTFFKSGRKSQKAKAPESDKMSPEYSKYMKKDCNNSTMEYPCLTQAAKLQENIIERKPET